MSAKDKIIFGLIIVLLIGGGYIQYTYTQILDIMAVLASESLYKKASVEEPIINTHVDMVNTEFREDLRKLNLEFIGRGKHVAKAQKDIISNTELIDRNTDSLAVLINEVQFNLDDFQRKTEKELADLGRDQRDLQESFDSYRRRLTRQLSDIEQAVAAIQSDVNKLNAKVLEKEGEKKK
ncbi:MAG: hypothetical protein ABIA75_04015 [Candidatus Neomarinimicrobiota bacterium]